MFAIFRSGGLYCAFQDARHHTTRGAFPKRIFFQTSLLFSVSSFVSLSLCLRRNACIFKFDVFGLCFDPSRFVLMDQINSAGDIADYGDFMLNRQWVKLHETLNQCASVEADTKCRWIFHNTQTHALSLSLHLVWMVLKLYEMCARHLLNLANHRHDGELSLRRRPKNNLNLIQKYIIMMMAMMISAITIQCLISLQMLIYSHSMSFFYFHAKSRCHHTDSSACLPFAKLSHVFFFASSIRFDFSDPPTPKTTFECSICQSEIVNYDDDDC